MDSDVLVAVITGAFACIVIVLNQRLSGKVKRLSADARATRNQVENNHDTNLREEGDERHSENTEKLDRILSEITRMRTSVGRLWERSDRHTDQIHDLELTKPPKESKHHD